MTATVQLTDQQNPLSQTFRVTEPGGSVITKIGLKFAKAPTAGESQHPIMVELRPVGQSGFPDSKIYFPETKSTVTAATVRAAASTTFDDATWVNFQFRTPLFVPENTEVAIVVYTAGPLGRYKIWQGEVGEFKYGSTKKKITSNLNAGSMFRSSNGTTWTASQNRDLVFRVHRAVFNNQTSYAKIEVDAPPIKKLTENTKTNKLHGYPSDPLTMTASSTTVGVLHPSHGFTVGDKVSVGRVSGFDSGDTVNGIPGSELLKEHVITNVDPFGYTVSTTASATRTGRFGGSGLTATEQYALDEFALILPRTEPDGTSVFAEGFLTSSQSFAGNETKYQPTDNVPIALDQLVRLADPHVLASEGNETHRLSGNASTKFNVWLTTQNQYTAPSINVNTGSLQTNSWFIDYQDSAGGAGRNDIFSTPLVAETKRTGGTNASKHITEIFILEDAATSIKVVLDAAIPEGSDIDVWYRVSNADAKPHRRIQRRSWTKFSKATSGQNRSNYVDIPAAQDYADQRQYEFQQFDMNDFDQYQIKITFHSSKQTQPPIISNLRTIATV